MTTSASQKVNRYYSCDNRDPLRAGGPDRVCKQQRIRADELDAFVWDKIQGVLLRPDVLLAGETAVISRQAPNDELLDTQRQRLARQLEKADTERRRLADLYQAGLIDLAELKRRGAEITARRANLEAEHEELTKRHQELAAGNRLRRRLADFAARVANGLDSLDFEGRQRLLRLVIEEVRVTGWQVEIRLRIPLSDNPGDGDEGNPPTPNSPSPKPTSVRRTPARRPVSTELRLSQGDP
jgi:hypothetical protein